MTGRTDAVILAGGRGTRLHPYTISIPKPLLPVGDIPILEVIVRQLAAASFGRIILTLGHMAPVFESFFQDGSKFGIPMEYSEEIEPLGTAGPLRQIEDLSDPFLVMNGDTLTTLDYRELVDTHERSGAAATIAVAQREVYIDFGVVHIGHDDSLDHLEEKPTLKYDVSMGINVLSRAALDRIPEQGAFDMPDLLRTLQDAGEKVICSRTDRYWQDIGRFDDFQRASDDFVRDPSRFLDGFSI
jgi:NDP-sugar pyrophosphorylase family protein